MSRNSQPNNSTTTNPAVNNNFLTDVRDGVNEQLDDTNSLIGEVGGALNTAKDFLDQFNGDLPLYSHSKAAKNKWEPVYLNQFEVVITPPQEVLDNDGYADLLIQQIKKLEGLPEIIPTGFVEQNYMGVKRTFSKPVPADTTATLTMAFEVNLNNRNSMYAYETLRAWAEMQFRPDLMMHGLKGNYAGEITVLLNNKRQKTFRQVNFKMVYMVEPLKAFSLDYLSEDIYVLEAKFKSDIWDDKRIKPAASTLL